MNSNESSNESRFKVRSDHSVLKEVAGDENAEGGGEEEEEVGLGGVEVGEDDVGDWLVDEGSGEDCEDAHGWQWWWG